MKFTVTFLDSNNNPFDPSTGIQINVEDPNGNVTKYAYSDSQLTRDSEGVYWVVVEATIAGYWLGKGIGVLPDGNSVTTFDVAQKVETTQVST